MPANASENEFQRSVFLNMKVRLANFFLSLKELCFPAACILCKKNITVSADIHLCKECITLVKVVSTPLCTHCGVHFAGAGKNHFCSSCLQSRPYFSKARSVLEYNAATAKIVHDFKYRGATIAFGTFQALQKQADAVNEIFSPDIVIPVPLHPQRLRDRGYNQAQLLAVLFYADMKKSIDSSLLVRARWTSPQTGLSGKERRKNLSGAFSVKNSQRVDKKNIVLVDDVYTTGTTLNECAKTLKAHGAKDVQALTLARVAG